MDFTLNDPSKSFFCEYWYNIHVKNLIKQTSVKYANLIASILGKMTAFSMSEKKELIFCVAFANLVSSSTEITHNKIHTWDE